jgi:hypothetical protein
MKKILFLFILVLVGSAFAQTKDVKEGYGVEGVVVGKSTKNDIENKLGKSYTWTKNKKYSFQMTYKDKGLAFYFCQSDKKPKVFVIEIKRPFMGQTTRGIRLGTSTRKEVEKLYGSGNSKYRGREYKGIEFYYTPTKKDEIVTGIDIYEKAGIRQCKMNK